jgi:ABC-2 type transport system permease protein
MTRLLRSAYVIARRDFTATVLSKTFILFLIGPLLPLLIGGVFFGIGASVDADRRQPVVAVIAPQDQFDGMIVARHRLVKALGDDSVPLLQRFNAKPDPAAEQKRLLSLKDPPVLAVLTIRSDRAVLAGAINRDGTTVRRLQLLLEQVQVQGRSSDPVPAIEVIETGQSSGKLAADRSETARMGQFLLFFLTMLLATMLLAQVVEEKSNKIIEVIAAAVPMDAMFLGKLFAMLAASVLGLLVWTSVGALLIASVAKQGLLALPPPAVGWPAFFVLTLIYFAMNYLILGALFLSIGAQASTPREVQTLSMPVTILQVVIFGLAATTIGKHDGAIALAGAAFPLSSPMVMIARAAELPDLWPHVVGVAWQILWVGMLLRVGARFFRSRVLKSGPATKRRFWRRSARA